MLLTDGAIVHWSVHTYPHSLHTYRHSLSVCPHIPSHLSVLRTFDSFGCCTHTTPLVCCTHAIPLTCCTCATRLACCTHSTLDDTLGISSCLIRCLVIHHMRTCTHNMSLASSHSNPKGALHHVTDAKNVLRMVLWYLTDYSPHRMGGLRHS